jgi:transcriptional regulator with XRE-family HTH domain
MGISQQKLSEELGLTKSTISLYEQGDNVPDIKNLAKIAEYFDVPYDYLLGKTDSQTRENIDISNETGLSDDAIQVLRSLIQDLKNEHTVRPDEFDLRQIPEEEKKAFIEHLLLFNASHKMRSQLLLLAINRILYDDIDIFLIPITQYVLAKQRIDEAKEIRSSFVNTVANRSNNSKKDIARKEFAELTIAELERYIDYLKWQLAEGQRAFAENFAEQMYKTLKDSPVSFAEYSRFDLTTKMFS